MRPLRTPSRGRRRDPQLGLTLIEVLAVLVVISVATGAATVGLAGADRDTRAQAEAVRLARHLSLAVDEALVSGLPLQMAWDQGGYSFVQWQGAEGEWQPAALPALAARHDLRSPLRMVAPDAGDAALLIAASGSGPARQFVFRGIGAPWRVQFDGFNAAAVPGGPA